MSGSAQSAFLRTAFKELSSAWGHLAYSESSVSGIGLDADAWDEHDLEKVEAFTSRFGRVVDLLVNRVLRAVDLYELLEPGTLLDTANRAEARGLIVSVDWLRELKDTRNRIAHDYSGQQLEDMLKYYRRVYPDLESCVKKVESYIDDLI